MKSFWYILVLALTGFLLVPSGIFSAEDTSKSESEEVRIEATGILGEWKAIVPRQAKLLDGTEVLIKDEYLVSLKKNEEEIAELLSRRKIKAAELAKIDEKLVWKQGINTKLKAAGAE